ncbi:MAG: RHS repeat-associated core domain-containing protein [Acidobacteriota bacterium]|nr:RHS repeat-associated core domain-containing protein [Acidobacteriota bacterium]
MDGFEAGDGSCWTSSVGSDIGAGTADCSTNPSLVSVYSSEGLLHAVTHFTGPTEEGTRYYFYFAGRPVAQMDVPVGGVAEVRWLSVDHLGTPVLATDAAGMELWQGGFEPFGSDYSGASVAGVDLRFPGQWEDGIWEEASEGEGIVYNLNRWYQPQVGRYGKVDPLLVVQRTVVDPFIYALSNPTNLIDPAGLQACKCNDECPGGEWQYEGWGFSFAAGGGFSHSRGSFKCLSSPMAKVKVKATCWLGGPILGLGIGVETGTPFAPAACGCSEDDLLGDQSSIVGNVFFVTVSVSGCGKGPLSTGKRTVVVGIAKSLGAGIAYSTCDVQKR